VRGGAYTITAGGELDLASRGQLERAFGLAEEAAPELIVLDLSGLEFIDSTGVQVIVQAHLRTEGRLVIVRGGPQVQRMFDLCRLDALIAFVDQPPVARLGASMSVGDGGEGTATRREGMAQVGQRASHGVLAAAIRELRSRPRARTRR
jgi:anti-sigma B factor antagonist